MGDGGGAKKKITEITGRDVDCYNNKTKMVLLFILSLGCWGNIFFGKNNNICDQIGPK